MLYHCHDKFWHINNAFMVFYASKIKVYVKKLMCETDRGFAKHFNHKILAVIIRNLIEFTFD